jgi:hypothetical protein
MLTSSAIAQVRAIVEDTINARWTDTDVKRALKDALRRVYAVIGRSLTRGSLSLVNDQAAYDLPSDLTRLRALRLKHRVGSGHTTLNQVPFESIPEDGMKGEPRWYALLLKGAGYSVELYPTPDANREDGLLMDYEVEPNIESDGMTMGTVDIPQSMETSVCRLAASELLRECDDRHDIEKAMALQGMVERELASLAAVDTLSFGQSTPRRFP